MDVNLLWLLFWMCVVFLVYILLQMKIKIKERLLSQYVYCRISQRFFTTQQQDQNINNNGRVQAQHPFQYPDAFLSVQHIQVTNELNKPPQDNDGLPTYEEATKMAVAQSIALQQSLTTHQSTPPASSEVNTTSPTGQVVTPAVITQTAS